MLAELAATSISEIKLRNPARVGRDMTLGEVVGRMREMHRGAAIVLDGDDQVQGIFTEQDLIMRAEHHSDSWRSIKVAEVMTSNPTTIRAADSLADALKEMREGPFRHLPVVDDSGALIGMVSIRDILARIAESFPEEFLNLPPDPEREASGRWGG